MAAVPSKHLDDAWLLSSAAALAEHPSYVHSMIKNKKTSKEGVY